MFESAWDENLDDGQLAAVVHGDGPLAVVAGAGTGKTRTLTSRVARLLERGTPAERILLLTFTRRAAQDMLARAAALSADRGAARRIWGGTFHAVAHRLVVEHAHSLGLSEVTVLDPGDANDLLELLRHEAGLTATSGAGRLPRTATIVDLYSRAVNTDRPARDVITSDFPWCTPHADAVMSLLRAYVLRKRERGLLDFDDLLLSWRALLAHPVVAERLRGRWDHVLVDEYQDVNQIQVDIVAALRPDGSGLTVVGDDAQAVYGFRGASSGHLIATADRWTHTTVVRLERNFRSGQALLDLANVIRPGVGVDRLTLVADRPEPGPRPRLVRCYDPAEEARVITDDVLAAVESGGRLRDHAVLMRSGHHSDLLEVELSARRVPFVKYGGLRFFDAAHVKDFLAALRVTTNPHDEVAWFRLLRLHDGIGPARARDLLAVLLTDGAGVGDVVAAAPARARTRLVGTLQGLEHLRGTEHATTVVDACLALVSPLVRQRYVDPDARFADLDRLAGSARTAANLTEFVAEVTLDPPASTGDYAKPPQLDEDYLTLSTVHSAKGLEWASVHLMHAVDGAFPSDMALSSPAGLAEEQRLFYVAVTRAQRTLSIYTPLRMPHHRHARDDRHSYAPESRFLTDDARATTTVVELTRASVAPPPAHDLPTVALPALDALFE